MSEMTPEIFQALSVRLMMISQAFHGLELQEYVERAKRSQAIGPLVVDVEKYEKGADRLMELISLAEAAVEFQKACVTFDTNMLAIDRKAERWAT